MKKKLCAIENCSGIAMVGWEICESCAYDMGYSKEEIEKLSEFREAKEK